MKTCAACGFSAADVLDEISSDASATTPPEVDASERAISVERRRIYSYLSKATGRFTIRQIAAETQVSQSTIRKALTELSDEGYVLSKETSSGPRFYTLTEAGHSRFRYSSETLGEWSSPRGKLKLYNVLTTISEPITIKDICKRSGASEYLIRKTIKALEQHGEAICENYAARPRKYTIKAGQYTESLLEP
ncbi:MAG: HTH domain-containing protein [Candidatus Hodarchaeales archaeon]